MTVAFAVTAAFMFALRPLANSFGLLDHPGGRKAHVGNVPIIGGLAMFIGVFVGLTLIQGPSAELFTLFVACLLLVAIGALDDRFGLPKTVRFAAQVAAALIMVYGSGLQLHDIGDPFGIGVLSLNGFSLIATVIVTVTIINAYNFVDGVDGLAGSLVLIGLMAVAIAGGVGASSTAIALMVATAIVGFLVFNFPMNGNRRLLSFMGDAGSTFLGFVIVWVALSVSQGSERIISPVYCLWFAAIPIFDCVTCFVRRLLHHKSPLMPGRDHFHHALQRGGLNVRQTLGVLVGLQAMYAATALTGHFAGIPDFAMFAGWSILGLSQCCVIRAIAIYHRYSILRNLRASAA